MRVLIMAILFVALSERSPAQLGKDLGDVSHVRGANTSDSQVTLALKEALSKCTGDAVKATGIENGFWGNNAIKIRMPERMQSSEKNLRLMAQGLHIDDFELSMNRAAEAASAGAQPFFARSIAELTFTDPRAILNGNSHAAIDYLRHSASTQLIKELRPGVEIAMTKFGVVQRYDYLVTQIRGVTLGKPFQFDITSYVVTRTLDGLLSAAGSEEGVIRANPRAQSSPLLKEVFDAR